MICDLLIYDLLKVNRTLYTLTFKHTDGSEPNGFINLVLSFQHILLVDRTLIDLD